MVRDQRINQLFEQIRSFVFAHQPLQISAEDVDYIRRNFHEGIRLGEKRLHEFARVLLNRFMEKSQISLSLIVVGRCPNSKHQEMVNQESTVQPKHKDFGEVLDSGFVSKYVPLCPICNTKTQNVATCMAYNFDPTPSSGILSFRTRIKSTSNIAYKIADLIFDIDRMFKRDKVYNEYSQVITDVYGVKFTVAEESQVFPLLHHLRVIPNVTVEEENDYTGEKRKQSGFEAYKIAVRWRKHLFELQIQSRSMIERELSVWTATHQTYKERLMEERRKLGKEYFELYEALKKMFSTPSKEFSEIDPIFLGFDKKGLDDEF